MRGRGGETSKSNFGKSDLQIPMRCFIAINLPPEIKDALEITIKNLAEVNRNAKINWTRVENLHLTLHFLDEITESQIELVAAELQKITTEYNRVNVSLDALGAFPDIKNPRAIFIGIKDGQILEKIQKKIGFELGRLGFKIDTRPWEAHITLGRVKTGAVKLDFKVPIGEFGIKSIELMKSTLTPSGPIYEVIKSFELQ